MHAINIQGELYAKQHYTSHSQKQETTQFLAIYSQGKHDTVAVNKACSHASECCYWYAHQSLLGYRIK